MKYDRLCTARFAQLIGPSAVKLFLANFCRSGCGSVGRAAASETRDPQFEPSRQQFYLLSAVLKMCRKTKKGKKVPGMAHFWNNVAVNYIKVLIQILRHWIEFIELAHSKPLINSLKCIGKCSIKLPMTGIKPRTAGIWSNRFAQCATATTIALKTALFYQV